MFNLNLVSNERECGNCSACCSVLGVEELRKPYYTNCVNLKENKCSIYNSKPSSCSIFECGWKMGLFYQETKYRPNNLGLLFLFGFWENQSTIEVFETRENAFEENETKKLMEEAINFSKISIIKIYPYGSIIPTTYEIAKEYVDYGGPTKFKSGQVFREYKDKKSGTAILFYDEGVTLKERN